MDDDILPKLKWNKGLTRKTQVHSQRRIPDKTIMGEAVRQYAERGGNAIDAWDTISNRIKKLWEKDTFFMIKEGDLLNTPKGLAKLAEKYKNTPTGSKPSQTTFKKDSEGNLIGIPEEHDKVSPRVRVFQRVHNLHTLDGHKLTEFYHVTLEYVKHIKRTSLYFSGNIYFILEENFIKDEARYSFKTTNREIILSLYKNGMVDWHKTEKLSEI